MLLGAPLSLLYPLLLMKSMRKVFSLLVLLLAVCTSAVAEQLTPEAALARLNAGKMKVAGVSKERLRLVHTAEQQDVRLFYIFQNADDGRSLILGADDLLPAVMAYGINAFDVNRMPAQVSEWLNFYEESSLQAILSSKPSKAPIQGNAVAPLVSSKWDQMDPYNRLCVEKMQRNMPVGCVATAMAQLMYFWKYPARGTGSHSYTASTGTLLSANFGSTEYPWDKMKDCYGVHAIDGSSEMEDTPFTDEEADAVSLLMYHCGVAVDMQYAEAGSGAYDSDAAAAMINYFGYDKGIKQTYRAVCTDDEWQQMLLDELSQGRPMFYSAHTRNNEGHSFICDGFDGKGYFHFNWGWSGMANGYYLVVGADPLHPQYHGTGGSISSAAYDQGQSIITGIQPAKPGSKVDVSMVAMGLVETSQGKCPAVLCSAKDVEVSGTVSRGTPYLLGGLFCGSSVIPMNADMGAILRNVDTGAEYPCFGSKVRSLKSGYGYSYIGLNLDYVPENGTYEIYPAYLPLSSEGVPLGKWQRMPMPPDAVPYRVTLAGTVPIFQITHVELSKENGMVTTNPQLSVTVKALATVSKKRLSCSVSNWDDDDDTPLGSCTISSSLTMKKGEEKTFSDLSFRFTTPLEENKAYVLSFSSLGLNYQLGDLNCSTYYFYVGDESLLPVESVPQQEQSPVSGLKSGTYNLQGQKVEHPQRGIYIRDGKKVLVR